MYKSNTIHSPNGYNETSPQPKSTTNFINGQKLPTK